MFVLGIDPGLTRCGFGLVEGSFDGAERYVARRAGVLASPKADAVPDRLASLLSDLGELLDELRPDVVVVERLFFMKNAKTAISVAQASGLALALSAARGCEVHEMTSQQVKLAVTGYGAASKSQVQAMVAQRCGLTAVPEPADAADALALAIAYLSVARTESRLRAVAP